MRTAWIAFGNLKNKSNSQESKSTEEWAFAKKRMHKLQVIQ